ncbi:MAG: SDR family NAD(P)-dependent oxidoreductase [Halioglobus sp.]
MKTILITGTTSGIGEVTAKALAQQGHRVVMANRNRAKSEALQAAITAAVPDANIELLDLDLASLASMRACAAEALQRYPQIDILINNAGLTSMEEVITEDGYELQFQVNALAQFLFTQALVPSLEAAAPAQVIFVTSMMHKFGKLNPESFKGWKKYNANGSYGQSKLAMMLLARELADRLQDKGIAVNTLHPGAVNTGILDNYSPLAQFFLRKVFIAPEKGAVTTLHLAGLAPEAMPTGKYFVKSKEAATHKLVEDAAARADLWAACADAA